MPSWQGRFGPVEQYGLSKRGGAEAANEFAQLVSIDRAFALGQNFPVG